MSKLFRGKAHFFIGENALRDPIRRRAAANYSTLAMASTTTSMFLVFSAATQMRPVSTA
jgi:hypothetical protein